MPTIQFNQATNLLQPYPLLALAQPKPLAKSHNTAHNTAQQSLLLPTQVTQSQSQSQAGILGL